MISAQEALDRLKNGNREFALSMQSGQGAAAGARWTGLPQVQNPFAIILGCSDARVSPEITFSQGLGDLFVIRVVGNIVTPSQLGSIEYAAGVLRVPLVVVLGHSQCGAIVATIGELQQPTDLSPSLRSIVEMVRPSVEGLFGSELRDARDARDDRDALVERAVRANVLASVNHLRHGSELLEQLIQKQQFRVVGAEYSLETGVVDFFEE